MPDILLLPQVNLLQSSTHRSSVQQRSFAVITAIYKQLYGNHTFENTDCKTCKNNSYLSIFFL